ncbi:hypothetical protein [Pseudomonas marincola]|uniref:hypothetical protein n=1 Tax=Pseudomonas marincola TaxID=437900 RepID=UPI0008E47B5E|nr:hypothetical protein [Pseudomonas marincola]SFT90940.1 hypothetical protein SAMN05216264_10610 [Pseudomonas marincola]
MRALLFLSLSAVLTGCTSAPQTPREPLVFANQPQTVESQLAVVRAAADKYRDFSVAEREGWKVFGDDAPLMGYHYSGPAPDYVSGDQLDFSQPNNLMYTDINGKKVLTGVAFVVRIGDGEPLPEGFAGNQDHWHVHDFIRAIDAATEERPFIGWLADRWIDMNYRSKGDNRGRLAMVHAWVTLPNPDGVFASVNRSLAYIKLGLPESYWQGASVEAARGLNLATEGGCEAVNGTLWIADVESEQEDAIKQACARSAEEVRTALRSQDKAQVNSAGESAWQQFDETWQRVLSPVQKERVKAMSEHGMDSHDEKGHMQHAH